MIEKIMKVVKSSNKKRGKNITVGAVVGLLLSCTAVMGADNYLWIKNDGEIKFSTDNSTPANIENPYGENTWDGADYVNNIALNSTSTDYGLKLEGDLGNVNFTNNGLIGSTGNSTSYGIYNGRNNKIGNIINNGSIIGMSIGSSNGSGINSWGTIEDIINSGLIIGENTGTYSGYGIDSWGTMGNVKNVGLIVGIGNGEGRGISIGGTGKAQSISNDGFIIGISKADVGLGISTNIINNGVISSTSDISSRPFYIYGKISNIKNNGLVIGSSTEIGTSYGIYANGGGFGGAIRITNMGSIMGITLGNNAAGINNDNSTRMYIANNGLVMGIGASSSYGIYNLKTIDSIEFDNSILNGKNDTLKVSGTGNEILGSIINAYGTAVVFDTAGGELTLSGTNVNGSVEEISNSIIGSGNGDTLILQSGEITYKNTTTGTENTVINGNIDMKAGTDTLTIGSGAVINGNVDMGAGDDILNFVNGAQTNGTIAGGIGSDILNFEKALSARTASSNDDEIRILHSISGFEKMNINTNVTLFEKTIKDDDATSTDLEVTGANEIKINAGGVLTLRLDTTRLSDSKIVGHALYGNNGVITSTGGGKLMLALNGAGNKSVVSFGDTALDGSLVTAYETKDKGKITFATTSLFHEVKRIAGKNNEVIILSLPNLPTDIAYEKLNEIYHSILSVDELRNFSVDDNEKLTLFLDYLNNIYAGNPYSYSSELSRKSAGMFRDIVTDNQFKANTGKWMIYGGLTHVDGGTKDTYYGKGYYTYDIGSSDMDADTKITGAYMLGPVPK